MQLTRAIVILVAMLGGSLIVVEFTTSALQLCAMNFQYKQAALRAVEPPLDLAQVQLSGILQDSPH